MPKGTTIFERWQERRKQANLDTEEKFVNPLGVRLGDPVSLDCLDWRDLDQLQVTQFRVVTRKIGNQEFPFTDYYLRHRGLEPGEERTCLLRYVPLDDPDPDSGATHEVYLLKLVGEFEIDEEVMEVLKQDSGYACPTLDEDGDWVLVEFPTRVNDVEIPYDCDVDIVKDADHDGEAEDDEVESHQITLWDFWRLISAEGVGDRTEYLFVEVDQEDGWTELFQGGEIDPAIVSKL
jgi:hypothetical protein